MASFTPVNRGKVSSVLVDTTTNTTSNTREVTKQDEAIATWAMAARNPAPPSRAQSTASSSQPQAKSTSEDKKDRPERNGRRLLPYEESTREHPVTASQRFIWNVGYFLNDVLGPARIPVYHHAEHLAEGIFRPPRTPRGMRYRESVAVNRHKERGLNWCKYRGLRARIYIAAALIYEHNYRGYHMNKVKVQRTGRLNPKDKFQYVNCGKSQAQMALTGGDVSDAGWVFELMEEYYLPDMTEWRRNFEEIVLKHGDKIDTVYLPAFERRELYTLFVTWMTRYEPAIPEHLFVAIKGYEVYDRPYERNATLKSL